MPAIDSTSNAAVAVTTVPSTPASTMISTTSVSATPQATLSPTEPSTPAAEQLKVQQIAKLKLLLGQKKLAHDQLSSQVKSQRSELMEAKSRHSYDAKSGLDKDKDSGVSVAKLEVEIMMAKDLPKMDWYSGKCDPYCVVTLSPPAACADQTDRRTKVKPRERSPVWNQTFTFSPIEFKKADIVVNVMDAENFGNDDFVGKVVIPLSTVDTQDWCETWYPLTDPDKKSEAKQLSGSLLIRCKFIHSEKLRLEKEVKDIGGEMEKLNKDMKKILHHIDRLEGKETKRDSVGADDVWLFAEFDFETPLLFTDCEPVTVGSNVMGETVTKYDMCNIL